MIHGHNNPPIVLELTQDEAEFLLRNCDSNIGHGLAILQGGALSESGARKIVDLIEPFKSIRSKVKGAMA